MRSIRQPGQMAFALVFPLFFLFVVSSGLNSAASLPGFPADTYVDFMFAIPFVHGALFTALNSAIELGRDIDTGFLNRLALTPVRGAALLIGQIGGAVGLGSFQALVYLTIALLAGVHIAAGAAGALLILLLAVLVATGFATLGLFIALKTGSGEGVQSTFPLLFFLLLISSMNLPRNLIEVGWFRALATLNPVSYMIEAIRSLVIVGWDAQALALGFGFTLALITVSLLLAARQLRIRMART